MKYIALYIAANVYDMIMTILGLAMTDTEEWGSITASFINVLGPVLGVVAAKVIVVTILILALSIWRHLTGHSIRWVLILGSICTIIGGSLWFLC